MANEQRPPTVGPANPPAQLPNVADTALRAGMHIGSGQKVIIQSPYKHGLSAIVLHQADGGEGLAALSRPDYPPRVEGTVIMYDADSFLEYWKRQADGTSYVYGSMTPEAEFVAVLNEHINAAPGESMIADRKPAWRDHRIVYPLRHSPEWDTWKKQDRVPFKGNDKFAYWLEDVLPDIISPTPETMMDIALNIKVSQSQGFQKAVNLNNGQINLAYSNNVDAGVQRPANQEALTIPATFKIAIPVFEGLTAPKYEMDARFRFHLDGGQLLLRYELVRAHKVLEQAFKDVVEKIAAATGKPVLFGKPGEA